MSKSVLPALVMTPKRSSIDRQVADATEAVPLYPHKTIYNRIASTLSNANPPSTPNPWDLIEAVNRPDLCYQIVERPTNSEDSPEEEEESVIKEEDEDTGESSFDLSEALEDIQQLNSLEGSDLVKPLDQLRSILVNAAVPVKERVEILRNLQLRDSWLLFLAKHFRRVLTKIKKEEDQVDERVRRLQDIFGQISENHIPPVTVSPASATPTQAPTPVSQPAQSAFVLVPYDEPVISSVSKHQVETGTSPPRDTTPPKATQSPRPKTPKQAQEKVCQTSDREVYQVTAVSRQQTPYPLCIKVVASRLGRLPLETSGLRHFSPSCQRRAQMRRQ